ncbi:alpha-amylase family glycosyl hydrolase [Hansschlegelia plantiphila]|uniref:Oligo-1,6-glucosidase n=1 Tax=Hansschlegelia plantiphila TaxID=374655 RepID=A0A9W6IZR2_9HYPH|nr:alpha-amylase family glycosyl hydrolase [Hansschlegelia plantiphila]GLK67116.1 oligo-1,6-glucosidase [Hansschlegelia plantiphila]
MLDVAWWRRGVVYQIYPRSFQDSDGDGIGDLEGVRRRLDHLVALGVDAVWLSPIFPSPMADFGYDVADYCGVDAIFGSIDDFDRLLDDAHGRGLKVILDFVPNHSSEAHPWFVESRRDRSDPRRDWYIWRDAAPGGGPPNNWISNFGGPAWTFDETTGQYYLHSFLREQPDLNWRNPELRAAMADVLRFWLDRGVDGFRIDVLWLLIKDEELRDNPENPDYAQGDPDIGRLLQTYSSDREEVFDVIRELRATVDDYDDRVLIGEIYLPVDRLVAYYGPDLSGVHLPFNFQLIFADWHARAIERRIAEYEAALPPGGWPNWVLGNHDQKRVATRLGGPQARVAAMLLLTLRGTPTLYYGDEIGLADVPVPHDLAQDPWEKNEPGHGRDPARTPMPWDATTNGGFTAGAPWLPMNDVGALNVAAAARDPRSILALHRALLALRRGSPALSLGAYEGVKAQGDVLAYRRRHGEEELLVALNLGDEGAELALPIAATALLSTHMDREGAEQPGVLKLRPNEGVVLRL